MITDVPPADAVDHPNDQRLLPHSGLVIVTTEIFGVPAVNPERRESCTRSAETFPVLNRFRAQSCRRNYRH